MDRNCDNPNKKYISYNDLKSYKDNLIYDFVSFKKEINIIKKVGILHPIYFISFYLLNVAILFSFC